METIGPYELEAPIGQGGMGTVWLARHIEYDWAVAIKRVESGSSPVDPFAEVRAIAGMHHAHIVKVLDYGEADGGLWIAMERAEASLAQRSPARWTEIRVVLESVLLALAHAHARGVLHLDVKPGNVLFARSGLGARWLLADFGLAHRMGTQAGRAVRGTPDFMAPEQFTGDTARFGPATDLYAVGCLAGLLVSGVPPFQARSVHALAKAHQFDEPAPLVPAMQIPPEFEAWWRRLLEKRPEDRFRLAADALDALESMSPVTAEPVVMETYRAQTFDFDALADTPVESEHAAPEVPVGPTGMERRIRMVAGPDLIDLRVLPLIGRESELAVLRAALDRTVESGVPHVVQIVGEPGSGRHHLARAFCTAANTAGRALLGLESVPSADRPVIAIVPADALEDWVSVDHPALLLVAGDSEVPLPVGLSTQTIALGPLSDLAISRVARNLVHLDESIVSRVARTTAGNPGRAVAMIRNWAARGRLVPGAFGHTVPPDDDGDEWLAGLAPDDPLLPLAWSIEEDPDGALELLGPRLREATRSGRPAESLWLVDLAERALAHASVAHPYLAWKTASLRAGTMVALGQMGSALAASRVATERARLLDDPESLAASLLQQAHVCRFLDEDPMPLLKEAEQIAPDAYTVGRARATRGSALIVAGELHAAIEVLDDAIEVLESNGEKRFVGTALYWLGNALQYDGQYTRSEAVHRRALAVFQERDHSAGIGQVLFQLIDTASLQEDWEKVDGWLEQAGPVVEQAGTPWLVARLHLARGRVLERQGRFDDAIRVLHMAIEALSDSEIGMSGMHLALGRVLLKAGRKGEAATHLAAADSKDVEADEELAELRQASLPSASRFLKS